MKAGKTRALGVGSPARMPELPDVPTLKELGILFDIPSFGFDLWGPAGMSPVVVQKISAALEQAVKDPGYMEISRKFVYDPVYTSPAALKDSIRYFESEIGPRLTAAAFPPRRLRSRPFRLVLPPYTELTTCCSPSSSGTNRDRAELGVRYRESHIQWLRRTKDAVRVAGSLRETFDETRWGLWVVEAASKGSRLGAARHRPLLHSWLAPEP
ncbi:MAG: hypothetical protein IPH51_17910 [Rubrivivax sp.]|nr:hypothetical protein [Rubrivivax sp.]